LIEASTESEWVARCLEELGHEVIVGDSNYAPMYSQRSRRIKTDLRDATALAEASKLGAYRAAHRTSDPRRHMRGLLAARDGVVRTRTRYILLTRSLLKREGIRVPSGSAGTFSARWERLDLPAHLREETAPLVGLMGPINEQIRILDQAIEGLARHDTAVCRLMTCPEIGPLTALSYVSTLDRVERFRRPHQVASYLGLVPAEWSSGESQRKGSITKAGSPRSRYLLVEAAHRIINHPRPETLPLVSWAKRIESRRGRSVATVAMARKLAGILFAMWRDEHAYDPSRLKGSRRV
jgi:transposase